MSGSDDTTPASDDPTASTVHEIALTLNGEETTVEVTPNTTVVELLREDLGLTGTTQGCGVGVCGSCTVLVDGDVVASCLELAVNLDGAEVVTVEGLADLHDGDGLHPLQESFLDLEGFQCGYCTPGMLLSSYALLQEVPDPGREDIEGYLSENICRCTGYDSIVDAVSHVVDATDE